jgi:preprotein translocase subunit YajC
MLFNLLDDAPKEGNGLVSFIIMGVLILAIIGLFIWQSITNKKRQKEAQNMVDTLKVGDRVKTIGGICGFVAEINNAENTFVLETGMEGNKSYVKFDKGAIYQTAPANPKQEKKEEVKEVKKEEKVEEKPAE